MARVCQEWYPNEKNPDKAGFYMDDRLKTQIDILLKNIKNDWDFTVVVAGQGEVRVGKSMLAMQIGAYWTYMIEKLYGYKCPFDCKTNFIFDGRKLIEKGNYLGKNFKYAALVFDEAGADLEGRKVMTGSTQDVLDFYRECGQYNLFNILVIPEFFDLPPGIALSRSIFLLDVFYIADENCIFQRGYFNFFSRRKKKELWDKGKKYKNYRCVNPDWGTNAGRFFKHFTINEEEYRTMKQEALVKRESKRRNKFQMQRDAAWFLLAYEGLEDETGKIVKLSQAKLAQRMEQMTGVYVSHVAIGDALRHIAADLKYEIEDNNEA